MQDEGKMIVLFSWRDPAGLAQGKEKEEIKKLLKILIRTTINSKKILIYLQNSTKYQQEERFKNKHKTSLLIGLQNGWLCYN
jgi:hypothetical protein